MMIYRHPGGLALTKRLIDHCNLAPLAKIADIGCGTGETVRYLRAERGLDAVGVDVSAVRLNEGKLRSPGLPLFETDAKNLPFAAASLDAVIAECSLSVAGDFPAVIAEISRVLKPGGKLALTDVYDKKPDSALPSAFFTYQGLNDILAENGFKILVWEDHAAFLAEFTASFIMQYGSIQELWQCITSGKTCPGGVQPPKINKPGYFLLTAEKCPLK